MSILPQNTILGNLTITEIYEYYDKPLLFACQNTSGHIYLVVLEDEPDDGEIWLYVTLSPTRFKELRAGTIDLHTAYKNSEDGHVLIVTTYHDNQLQAQIEVVDAESLTDDQLPEVGERLTTETIETIVADTEVSLQIRARQLLREYVELVLHFPGQRQSEAPISILSEILSNFQSTLNYIANSLDPLHNDSVNPTRDLKAVTQLSLLVPSEGSFKLEMASSIQADMFGETLIGDALQELSRLISLGNNKENLQATLTGYKPNVPKSYLDFLKAIGESRIDKVDLRWASASGQRSGNVSLTIPTVLATIDTIEQMVDIQTRIIRVTGELTGAFTSRRFEITTQDNVYEGKLDNQALSVEAAETINNAQLGKRYTVQMRETITYHISTNQTTRKYSLIDVFEAKL
ncbi:MAG: hypothetical protein LCI00_29070 [Chloroflexi bacterium]|nr:hypothetical protein [Chloroflexota bacterium]